MLLSPWVEVPFEVQAPHKGLRVDSFLALRLRRYSRAEVQRLIAAGRVFLRGRSAKASARIRAGERVLIRYPRRLEEPPRYQALPVLYQDEDLLAVNKPADLICHPTDKVVENSAVSILRRQFPGKGLLLAHRLDRETSGVLLLARNRKAARKLAEEFAERRIRKEYLAVVQGLVPWKRTALALPVGREGLEIKVRQKTGAGQEAATEFECLGAGERHCLVKAMPRTGRLHQIRVHLAALGHPVVGDKLYTGKGEAYLKAARGEMTPADLEGLGAPRQMLHASSLLLRHPRSGAELALQAPPPPDFADFLSRAGLSLP